MTPDTERRPGLATEAAGEDSGSESLNNILLRMLSKLVGLSRLARFVVGGRR